MQVNASKCMHGDVWVCMSMLTVLNRHANSQTSLACFGIRRKPAMHLVAEQKPTRVSHFDAHKEL